MSGPPSGPGGPPPPDQVLMQMIMGKLVSKAVSVAADLGVADHIGDAPVAVATLAEKTGTHAPSLYRLLRALAGVGVFAEGPQKSFALTPVGKLLRADAQGSMRAMARWINCEPAWTAWGKLGHSVATGEPCFDAAMGAQVFDYFAAHPDIGRIFNDAMTSFSVVFAGAVAKAYDFSSVKHLCDVGGGHGMLLSLILGAFPGVRGTLFDRPDVVAGAPPGIEKAGLSGRIEIVAGDFFKAVPKGADAYILKAIIHDWSDELSGKILSVCREAMAPGGKVLVVETIVSDKPEAALSKIVDLEMLAMTHGGRERTEAEFAELFRSAGLTLKRVVPTQGPLFVLEGALA